MRTRQIVAVGMAIAMATVMTLQPVVAGKSQGAGAISGIAKEAKKPYTDFSVRGRIVDGVGIGNLTTPVPLDTQARFNLAGIDLAKYQVELLNKQGKVVCTEGPVDLTKLPNQSNVVIDCGNPYAWVLLGVAAITGITAGVVAAGDEVVSGSQ